MGMLTITTETAADVTVISNTFIDKYMKDANDAQLKVYLYIFRMIQSHTAFSVPDIADQFNHTEREVLRALKYWEKQKLMELTFDGSRTLTGIRLLNPDRKENPVAAQTINAAEQASASPAQNTAPVQSAQTVAQPQSAAALFTAPVQSAQTAAQPQSAVALFTAPVPPESNIPAAERLQPDAGAPAVQAVQPDTKAAYIEDTTEKYAKPAYSADQLRVFREKESTAQLLFIAQAYVGKPLSSSDMKTILYMSDVLEFSDDLIDYLIQYCVEKGKRDFRYMEKVAINWAEEGIRTPKQAEKAALKYDKSVYAIMSELGKSSAPTTKELEYINRWIKEYGFGTDVIFEACARTVLATDKHRFEYADGILSNWKKENVHHKSDIKKLDDDHAQKRTQAVRPVTNKFNQFTQNSYDFKELEKALLNN